MDYKKLYEKAVERAKTLTNSGFNDFDFVKHIFPELAESEDEKMRKGIIRNLEYLMDRAEGFVKDELKERIAWLEKQKPVGWSVEDSIICQEVIHVIDNCERFEQERNHENCVDFHHYQVLREWLKFLSNKYISLQPKQGEQKSAEFKPSFRVGDVIKPKDPVLGEPRIIKGIHPKFGYDTNNGILDFEYEDNWEAVEEPVSEELEEASKNYALNNTPWDDCKDEIQEAFKAGAKWQKEKDESTTEDLGEYINELSKQFPEVSFAKLSRIAVRVAKWQEQKYKEALNIYLNSQRNKGK